MAKYINPFTDYGFKKIFGEEASKPILMDFLNALLPETHRIVELTFKNSEKLGATSVDRKAIYDIYCENGQGEKFIVEMQKAKQNYFRERTIYYSTFPIREQADKGEWNYQLKAVYCVGILDFTFDDYDTHNERNEVVHTIKLKNQHGDVFYDKLTYIYLELPNFHKDQKALTSRLDQWMYFIKHLEDFHTIPDIFGDSIFKQAFEKAEKAKLAPAEMDQYEESLKVYRDLKAVVDTAFDDGKIEGKIEGMLEGKIEGRLEGEREAKLQMARSAKSMGLTDEDIMKLTGLSAEDMATLRA